MLRGISDLRRLTIAGADGNLGSVGDVYFDDRSWSVRYLTVEADTWFPGGRVFIPPVFVRSSDSTTLRVASSKAQVKVSSMVHTGDPHLQTATVLMGYAMEAEDGEIGHVKDVLVDDQAWAIRYLVVDTEKWWGGKTVLVSPEWLTRVTWDESKTLFCLVTTTDDTAHPRTSPGDWPDERILREGTRPLMGAPTPWDSARVRERRQCVRAGKPSGAQDGAEGVAREPPSSPTSWQVAAGSGSGPAPSLRKTLVMPLAVSAE